MPQIAIPFLLTLLHSVWQSALLYFFAVAIERSISFKALQKTQLFYRGVVTQLLVSAATFCCILFSNQEAPIFTTALLFPGAYLETALCIAYGVVVCWKFAATIITFQNFSRSSKKNLLPAEEWINDFVTSQAFRNLKKSRRKLQVFISTNITTPLVVGFIKPVILFPASLLTQLTVAETEALLLHEIAHLKHNDLWRNLVLVLAETIFFFNPFLLGLGKRVKLNREIACDEFVVRRGFEPQEYAHALLLTARFAHNFSAQFALAAFNEHGLLKQRVLAMSGNKPAMANNWFRFVLTISVSAIIFLFLGQNRQLQETVTAIQPVAVLPVATPANAVNNELPKVLETEAMRSANMPTRPAITNRAMHDLVTHKNPELISPEPLNVPGVVTNPEAIAVTFNANTNLTPAVDVLIEKETSGMKVQQVYSLTLENGEITSRLQLQIVTLSIAKDSLPRPSTDSLHLIWY